MMNDIANSFRLSKLNPILVTGAHHSGTTWVGRILTLDRNVAYVDEVFNPIGNRSRPLGQPSIFDQWYTYVTSENEELYGPSIAKVLQFKYTGHSRLHGLPRRRYGGQLFLALRNLFYQVTTDIFSWPVPLLKDPIALLSSEWLARTFQMRVVLLIRHPAAFVDSVRRRKERFDFQQFLGQEHLMEDWLHPLAGKIKHPPNDSIGRAALLWLCLNYVIDGLIKKHPDWILVRHEDLARDPHSNFRLLYSRLSLHYSIRVSKRVATFSTSKRSGDESSLQKAMDLNRDSLQIIRKWKRNLSAQDAKRIKDITGMLADKYYPMSEW